MEKTYEETSNNVCSTSSSITLFLLILKWPIALIVADAYNRLVEEANKKENNDNTNQEDTKI